MDLILNLNLHSEYSLADGAMQLANLFPFAKEKGLSVLGLSDFCNLHGAREFLKLAEKFQIKPLLGLEVLVKLPNGHSSGVLPLFARTARGYHQLLKLASHHGCFQGEISWKVFEQYQDDLLLLLGHKKSFFWEELLSDGIEGHLSVFEQMKEEGRLFLQIGDDLLSDDEKKREKLICFSQKGWGKLLYAPSLLYLDPSDRSTYLNLLAIKHNLKKEQLSQIKEVGDFSLLTPFNWKERTQHLAFAPQEGWSEFLSQIDLHLPKAKMRLPHLPLEKEEKTHLRELVEKGLEERREQIQNFLKTQSEKSWEDYEKRIETELEIISNMEFTGYFLIVHDYVSWCHREKISVGPGRGSAAGSLVTYCLGITNVDPLRFNLLFERFLNPERISLPDIDTDFCQEHRDRVLQYVSQRYGAERVAQIITFGRLKARNALKSICRISGWSFQRSNDFCQKVPQLLSLQEALKATPELQKELDGSSEAQKVWNEALKIEGTLNSFGIHAAGVIIADTPLDEVCPLMVIEGQTITQFEQKASEASGLIKFDFLGLKNLTIIQKACDLIQECEGKSLSISEISLDDPKVFDLLKKGSVWGVFQLESPGMKRLVQDLQPGCFDDVMALLALYRPGPLGSGMVDDFVIRKHGRGETTYLFPQLEPILKETYGLIIYQEQVQRIASSLAGYSLGEADLLRRAMGKKNPQEMEKQRERFLQGMEKNQFDRKKSEHLFDLMAKFAEYGFNKSHSTAYGFITYQTAYLKTYYPRYFLTAQLCYELESTDRLAESLKELRRCEIELFSPCVNHSEYLFTIEGQGIRFGLGALKGLGKKFCHDLVEERQKGGPFSSVPEFLARLKDQHCNKRVVEKLIYSGSFDGISSNRAELFRHYAQWMESIQKERTSGHFSFFEKAFVAGSLETPLEPESSSIPKHLFRSLQFESCPDWSWQKKWAKEQDEFGFFLSQHPISYLDQERSFLNLKHFLQLDQVPANTRVLTLGLLKQVSSRPQKKDKKKWVIRFEFEDEWGSLMAYQNQLQQVHYPLKSCFLIRLKKTAFQKMVRYEVEKLVPFEEWIAFRLKRLEIIWEEEKVKPLPLKKMREMIEKLPSGSSQVDCLVKFPREGIVLKSLLKDKAHLTYENFLDFQSLRSFGLIVKNHYN